MKRRDFVPHWSEADRVPVRLCFLGLYRRFFRKRFVMVLGQLSEEFAGRAA